MKADWNQMSISKKELSGKVKDLLQLAEDFCDEANRFVPSRRKIELITNKMSDIGSELANCKNDLESEINSEEESNSISVIEECQKKLQGIRGDGEQGKIGYMNVDDYAEQTRECCKKIAREIKKFT